MKLLFLTLVVPVSPFINLQSAVLAYNAWQKNPAAESEVA